MLYATLKLKIIYDSSVTSQPENTVGTLSVTLDYVQNDGSGTVTPGGETAADKLIATETTSGDAVSVPTPLIFLLPSSFNDVVAPPVFVPSVKTA